MSRLFDRVWLLQTFRQRYGAPAYLPNHNHRESWNNFEILSSRKPSDFDWRKLLEYVIWTIWKLSSSQILGIFWLVVPLQFQSNFLCLELRKCKRKIIFPNSMEKWVIYLGYFSISFEKITFIRRFWLENLNCGLFHSWKSTTKQLFLPKFQCKK